MILPAPIRRFPLEKGAYEVAPGLKPLGGELTFELDSEFARYRENVLACRRERLSKYLGASDCSPEVFAAVNRFLAQRMAEDQPAFFKIEPLATGKTALHCALTRERLLFDPGWELLEASGPARLSPPYLSAFDALCSQVQEDVAVTRADFAAGRDWLAAIHLCSPSHWSAEDKLGKSFFDIHAPVPGIERINRAARSWVEAMIRKGPYSRFVWGFATDRRLNHHPEPPPGEDRVAWRGRSFERSRPGSPFILRVERQVLHGLPEVSAAIFTIRVSFVDGSEIRADPRERALLRSALLSMTPESRVYKGLADCMEEVIAWLDETG